MTIQKRLFLFVITCMCISTSSRCMQPDQQPQINPLETEVLQAKKDYYASQSDRNTKQNDLDQDKHSHTYIAKSAAVQTAAQVSANQINQGLDYFWRWISGGIAEEKALNEEVKKDEKETRALAKEKEKKEAIFFQTQTDTKKGEDKLQKIRIIRERMDSVNLLRQQGIYDHETASKKFKQLYEEIENLEKIELQELKDESQQINDVLQTLKNNNTDPKAPEYQDNLKRIQQKEKQLELKEKQVKSKELQMASSVPAALQEESKKTIVTKTTEEKSEQDSFFKNIKTYCGLAVVSAGTAADALADYSFKNITDLDCFKGTFIGNNSKTISRGLVFITGAALAYKGYSLYKAYQAERNFKEEDIFNDDLD